LENNFKYFIFILKNSKIKLISLLTDVSRQTIQKGLKLTGKLLP